MKAITLSKLNSLFRISLSGDDRGMINGQFRKIYAFTDSRYSQQLHAIANPSEEDVALPSSSITIRLLSQFNKILVEIIA